MKCEIKNTKELGAFMAVARKMNDLTLRDVANELGVGVDTLSEKEIGSRQFKSAEIMKLCELYGITFTMEIKEKDE